jgi:hypothetical protein
MFDYIAILIYLLVAGAFAAIFSGAAFFLAFRRGYGEKTAQYECGFDPFDDARSKFDVRFYLVALLFLIMDLEVRPVQGETNNGSPWLSFRAEQLQSLVGDKPDVTETNEKRLLHALSFNGA